MHLEVLVEEASAEAALNIVLPGLLGAGHTFKVHPHNGKRQLFGKLPKRLRSYAPWIDGADVKVVVLVDRDSEDCKKLKARLETAARAAGLALPNDAAGRAAQLYCRIAVEELEAWFFGDPQAVCAVFPKVPTKFADAAKHRDPDEIADTWEALEKILQKAGYYRVGLQKIDAATRIAEHMDPDRNRSPSFQAFAAAVRQMAGSEPQKDDDVVDVEFKEKK